MAISEIEKDRGRETLLRGQWISLGIIGKDMLGRSDLSAVGNVTATEEVDQEVQTHRKRAETMKE